jgi:hypothetical protein
MLIFLSRVGIARWGFGQNDQDGTAMRLPVAKVVEVAAIVSDTTARNKEKSGLATHSGSDAISA